MPEDVRVLHVEDDPDFADLVAEFLEREDGLLDVETAPDAAAGLDRLAEGAFDCVVSDYDMPGRNGIEFLEVVREDHPDLPFILYTGKGSEEVASDAISAGATDYLQKGGGVDQYELLANRIRNTVEQYRAQRRAAEYDRLRTLASDVNQALVHAETRTEAERRVCEIISESEPYRHAWIGAIDPDTDRVEPRTWAGIEDEYVEGLTVTVDDSPTGAGPGGTALREGRVAVSQDVAEDPAFEPWRESALAHGFRSVGAVPLAHAGSRYGLLAVYAERADAFDEPERELLAELGDTIARAFHSFDVRERLRAERDRRQALFENAPAPVIAASVDDGDHRISAVNGAFEDVFGYVGAEIVGRDVADVIVPEEGRERHEAFRERANRGEAIIDEVVRHTVEGPAEFLLTIIPFGIDGDGIQGLYAWYTDISEQRERERTIAELHAGTDALMSATSREGVAEIAVETVRDVLDLPANGVHLYDEDRGVLAPTAWTPETEEFVGEPPAFEPGEAIAWTAFETGEPQVHDDIADLAERHNPDTDVRSQIALPLGEHGVLLIGSPETGAFGETDVSLAMTLTGHVTTALDRIEREAELERREQLLGAVVETSIDGILVVDEDREYVTWNEQFVEMWGVPEELVGEEPESAALEWVLDQLEEPEQFMEKVEHLYEHPAEESRDRLHLTDGRVFDRYSAPVEAEDGIHYGRVWFFRDVTDQVDRERALTRQNEQLAEFASIVSHDLRSPLNVADGRLALAREEHDGEHLQEVAAALDRMAALIEDLLTLAREGERVSELEDVDLADTVRRCWRSVEAAGATLEVTTDQVVRADRTRLMQLVENFLRNSVEHGGDGVRITVGALEAGAGFYVADDGPGIPADARESVFDAGYSTAEDGTGFGLAIVEEVADAHGWTVEVTESEAGGARFEISGVEVA